MTEMKSRTFYNHGEILYSKNKLWTEKIHENWDEKNVEKLNMWK